MVTVVRGAQELQAAVAAGARDIEIRSHLNLTALEPPEDPDGFDTPSHLMRVDSAIRSMRGVCEEAPPSIVGADAVHLKPRQCVVTVGGSMMQFLGGRQWLDNLLFHLQRTRVDPGFTLIDVYMSGAFSSTRDSQEPVSHVYLTNVTVQGDRFRAGSAAVLNATSASRVLVEDCEFKDIFGGTIGMFHLSGRSSAAFVRTSFRNISLNGAIVDVGGGGIVQFTNTTFAEVQVPDDTWVTANYDDYTDSWAYELNQWGSLRGVSNPDIPLDSNQHVPRVRAPRPEGRGAPGPGDPGSAIGECAADEAYVVPYAMLYNEAYAVGETLWQNSNNAYSYTGDYEDSTSPGPGSAVTPDNTADSPSDSPANVQVEPESGDANAPASAANVNPSEWLPEVPFLTPNDTWIIETRSSLPQYNSRDAPANAIGPPAMEGPNSPSNFTQMSPSEAATPDSAHDGNGDSVASSCVKIIPVLDMSEVVEHGGDMFVAGSNGSPRPSGSLSRTQTVMVASAAVVALAVMMVAAVMLWRSLRARRRRRRRHSRLFAAADTHHVESNPIQEAPSSHHRAQAMPDSAMNAAYEYRLPTHLALISRTATPLQTTMSGSMQPESMQMGSAGTSEAVHSQHAYGTVSTGEDKPDATVTWPGPPQHGCPERMPPLLPTPASLPPSSTATSQLQDTPLPVDAGDPVRAQHHMGSSSVHVDDNCTLAHVYVPPAAAECRTVVVTTSSTTASGAPDLHIPLHHTAPVAFEAADNDHRGQSRKGLAVHIDAGRALDKPGPASTSPGNTVVLAPYTSASHSGQLQRGGQRSEVEACDTDATKAPRVEAVPMSDGNEAAVWRLHRQLDGFGRDDLFLGRYVMLGRARRRRGGQAVVQFAQDPGSGTEFAVKLFLDRSDFLTEVALYATSESASGGTRSELAAAPSVQAELSRIVALSRMASSAVRSSGSGGAGLGAAESLPAAVAWCLPHVEAVCDGQGIGGTPTDPRGRPLPPCIVMEKGESLHDWSDRAEPDHFTSLAVLSNISERLADLHKAGYVHRDLKPANVMWLPRQNRWTVIDFGCVARIGEDVPLSFTLTYAAPEVVQSFLSGARLVRAAAAQDAWALGVMALELLTGAPAFDLVTEGTDAVVEMLKGARPLPWETGVTTQHSQRAQHARTGPLGGLVLQLLHRDPQQRLSTRGFHEQLLGTDLLGRMAPRPAVYT